VRVGKETFDVKEQSTGFDKLKDAREYASKLESDIREHALNPNADRTKKTTFDDCLKNYLNKKRPSVRELSKIMILCDVFEGVPVSDIKDKWNKFYELHRNNAISTINRYLALLKSILNLSREDLNITPPEIKPQPIKNTRVFVLKDDIRELLLNSYGPHVKPIFTVMAYQGFRTQECLQILWEDIDFHDERIIIRTSKNGETRSVPMHKKVKEILFDLWIKRGNPLNGHVWLTPRNKEYKDTRKISNGSSPIIRSHKRALEKLKKEHGIELKMRVHDWRHDWASRMVMAGVDLITVQRLGGWKSLDMVKRYATLSNKHEQDAINKI
jgi:integrase